MEQNSHTATPTANLDLEARQAAEKIYDLKIHEKTAFELEGYDQDVEVLRVPGGWIYRIGNYTSNGLEYSNSVFVPFHQEVGI
ncbi:hypothetical protein [Desulfobacter latus]|uniref:Uncharacterized protein n=1 Tax=Desulfobacter latus TaxID=2292 RepID=A0A850T504_9BACT|nr:hypothetical protein [Desulfobacter latus]NWH06853.1 hypothetical protein [Desulfobacter latus]